MSDDLANDPQLIEEFVTESREGLQCVDEDLLALEQTPDAAEVLDRVFRTVHSIKGTASFLNFPQLVELAHAAEDVLNGLRKGEFSAARHVIDVLLASADQLRRMIEDVAARTLRQYDIAPLLQTLRAVRTPADGAPRLGSILVQQHVVGPTELAGSLREAAAQQTRLGDLLVNKGLATPEQIQTAVDEQAGSTNKHDATQLMRVDVAKLDHLVNLVGELILERNRLSQLHRSWTEGQIEAEDFDSALGDAVGRLTFVTDEMQVASLKTRMVPIENVFRKFTRLVRDVGQNLKKEVRLVQRGAETELDKTVVEQIADPLVHLVRNALDHGIESPAEREAAGKPREGTIVMEAFQQGDHIIIRVLDDGKGIDPQRIADKALQKGLVTPERLKSLSEREIIDLIFLPGFSTAEKATEISGRGVGMDVVRTNLKKMNGTVQIDSSVGKGSTFTLKLPLTMAIMSVLLVDVADEELALPLQSVCETLRTEKQDLHYLHGREVIRLRNGVLPVCRLSRVLHVEQRDAASGERVVVINVAGERMAVLVDHLLGQEQTVVKPLGSYLGHVAGIAGASITGDGRVRLIVDPAGLVTMALGTENQLPEVAH